MKILTSVILALATFFSVISSLLLPGSGREFYFDSVNGNDFAAGTSASSPRKSLQVMNKLVLKPGDTVYLRAGSVFRGVLSCREGVTYKAYGEGEKPTFLGSADASAASGWKKTDYENVWVFGEILYDDVGNIIFDGGSKNAVKKAKGILNSAGIPAELENDLEFVHASDNRVYLYSEENPGERFRSVEMAKCRHVIRLANDVTVDGIRVLYGGAHGMAGSDLSGVTVRNCEIGWVGGSLQPDGTPVRYGNGIEFLSGAVNCLAENNEIYQIYDAGLTFQSGETETYDGITFRNNHISCCTYSIEVFCKNGGTMKNILFDSNVLEYAGMGWGSQRPDPVWASHINTWNREINYENFVISGNTFNLSSMALFHIRFGSSAPVLDGNRYIHIKGRNLDFNYTFGKSDAEAFLRSADRAPVIEYLSQ